MCVVSDHSPLHLSFACALTVCRECVRSGIDLTSDSGVSCATARGFHAASSTVTKAKNVGNAMLTFDGRRGNVFMSAARKEVAQ